MVRPKISPEAWVTRLRDAATGRGADAERVHSLRVACARLRVWLALASLRAPRRDLRWLRRRASDARNLDVWLATSPPQQIARSWETRRAAAWRQMEQALRSSRTERLIQDLDQLPALPVTRMARGTKELATRLLHMKGGWKEADALHRRRRRVRRLRYALEWQGQSAPDLVRLQDALGEACDRAFTLAELKGNARVSETYRSRMRLDFNAARKRARYLWRELEPRLKALAQTPANESATA